MPCTGRAITTIPSDHCRIKLPLKITIINIGGCEWHQGFIRFVSDHVAPLFATILFADDTTLCLFDADYFDLTHNCNEQLTQFYEWTLANRLSLNLDKTCILSVSNNNNPTNTPAVILNNETLHFVDNTKFLGVLLEHNLYCQKHISYICSKISKSLGILYKLQEFLPVTSLIGLYYTFVYPYLIYCIPVWGSTTENHLYPLIVLQKRIIRIINKKPFLYHTNDLFFENEILKIHEIYKFRTAVRLYKLNNFSQFQTNHAYNTRFRQQLRPTFERLTQPQRSINYRGPMIYNEIPEYIKNAENLCLFKKRLKRFYIDTYSPNSLTQWLTYCLSYLYILTGQKPNSFFSCLCVIIYASPLLGIFQ